MIIDVTPSHFEVKIGHRVTLVYTDIYFTDKALLKYDTIVLPRGTTQWEPPHDCEPFTDADRQSAVEEVVKWLTDKGSPVVVEW
ncbi:hypothetical protein Plim_0940 [Planctopirus limnophila DSM 3776]|uniref:Uncharacterized protein n=1 Tax=Planctopirus limnophila (strain ATCC 43296 / DSM 3776 / IFAM 1008 / Mu 290) TaxID=521674 RepID=D5ST16_PLAL2|nr:hypothetical protein Plim_0940 [Planctopirus limnophila DSM 3776]